MNDPVRLRDLEGGDLLRRAAPTRAIPLAVRRRSAARVARLGVVPAVGVAALLFKMKGALAAALVRAKIVAAVVGLGAAGVVVAATVTPPAGKSAAPAPAMHVVGPVARHAAARAVVAAEPVVRPDEPIDVADLAAAEDPPAQARPSAPAPRASAPAMSSADALVAEAASLEETRALLEKNPTAALAKLGLLAATYPAGTLGVERELLTIDALRRLGRVGEARARADAMLARPSGALYEARIRRMLGPSP